MPNEEHFTKMMRSINVRKSDHLIIYDKYRNISAPRTYFMMKCFGLPNVWVLNGTFSKWESEHRPIDQGGSPSALKKIDHKTSESRDDFNFKLDRSKINVFEEIHSLVEAH